MGNVSSSRARDFQRDEPVSKEGLSRSRGHPRVARLSRLSFVVARCFVLNKRRSGKFHDALFRQNEDCALAVGHQPVKRGGHVHFGISSACLGDHRGRVLRGLDKSFKPFTYFNLPALPQFYRRRPRGRLASPIGGSNLKAVFVIACLRKVTITYFAWKKVFELYLAPRGLPRT